MCPIYSGVLWFKSHFLHALKQALIFQFLSTMGILQHDHIFHTFYLSKFNYTHSARAAVAFWVTVTADEEGRLRQKGGERQTEEEETHLSQLHGEQGSEDEKNPSCRREERGQPRVIQAEAKSWNSVAASACLFPCLPFSSLLQLKEPGFFLLHLFLLTTHSSCCQGKISSSPGSRDAGSSSVRSPPPFQQAAFDYAQFCMRVLLLEQNP